jgi:hypothetical protein
MGRHTSISARSNFPSAQPTFDTSARRHLGPSCQSHAHTIALTCGAYCPVASSALIRWILPLAPRTHRAVSPLRASPTYRNGLPQLARAMTGIRRPVTPFKKPKPHLAPIKAAAVPPSPVFNLALHRIRESPSLPGHHKRTRRIEGSAAGEVFTDSSSFELRLVLGASLRCQGAVHGLPAWNGALSLLGLITGAGAPPRRRFMPWADLTAAPQPVKLGSLIYLRFRIVLRVSNRGLAH